jgi:hypothetical protein
MDVHPTCEGEVTIHKCKKIHQLGGIAMGSKYLFSLCCPKKILVARSIVLENLLSDQFAQRDSTPAWGGITYTTVANGGLRRGSSGGGGGCRGGKVLAPCWCSLHGASLPVLPAPTWRSGGSVDEGAAVVASKSS